MKKAIIFVAVLVLVVLIAFAVNTYLGIREDEYISNLRSNLNTYLLNEDYNSALNMYTVEEEKYHYILNEEIDVYIISLCKEGEENLFLDKLVKFKSAGGNTDAINTSITNIETRIAELEQSAEHYTEGISSFENRDFEQAKINFEAVIDADENYMNAQNYIGELNIREQSWNNNIFGRNGYINSAAFDGEYLYVPFVQDGIDGIYKITAEGKAEMFFPLSDEAGTLYINGLNIVGDYLYFIAGENVGSGYAFQNPYSVYEMKTDGTGLVKVLDGNFTDLYIKGTDVYAISREFGLVKYDSSFKDYEVISNEIISEFTFDNTGIYYTVRGDLTHDSDNTAYFYDGSQSTKIDTKEYLHYYNFSDNYIKHWHQSDTTELLKLGIDSDEIKIENIDLNQFYGIVDSKVLYSYMGKYGQKVYKVYDIDAGKKSILENENSISLFDFCGIWYEQDKILVEASDQLYISDAMLTNLQVVDGVDFSDDDLIRNSQVINHLTDEDIYLQNGEQIVNVIVDKQNWVYKDENLNIVLEKRYLDQYDCNVYITHVFTKDYNLFTTGNGKPGLVASSTGHKASEISQKYNAIYAQSTDGFYYGGNTDKGIIIREGIVVRSKLGDDMIVYFSDGTMDVYRSDDAVTAQMLTENGAIFSASWGPILVEDYNVNVECANAYPYYRNPRSAVGYVEPGHYVMMACDGRDNDVTVGLTLLQLAQVLRDEGCVLAYNMDGGATTTVLFMGNYITRRAGKSEGSSAGHRKVAEIFYIGTNEMSPLDLNDYKCSYDTYQSNYK